MVHTSTYIFMIITILLGFIGFHRFFEKHRPMFGYGKLILSCIGFECVMLFLAVTFPSAFPVLIYGSILMASYVCVYYRYRQKIGGEW